MATSRSVRRVSLAGRIAKDKVRLGFEDATPERLKQARLGGSASVDGQGLRRIAEPFDVLRARHLLDRTDAAVNEVLWQAGDRLRGHWHRGMLDGLSTLDPSRPSVDCGGGGPGALNPTESAVRHRQNWHRAAEWVGARLFPYVEGIVVSAQPIGALRGLVGDTAHARTADALVLERLREGLHRLADLWSMHRRHHPVPVRTWREPPPAHLSGTPHEPRD